MNSSSNTKKLNLTRFWEVRDDSNGFRDSLKPWVSLESIFCCKHLLTFFLRFSPPSTFFFLPTPPCFKSLVCSVLGLLIEPILSLSLTLSISLLCSGLGFPIPSSNRKRKGFVFPSTRQVKILKSLSVGCFHEPSNERVRPFKLHFFSVGQTKATSDEGQ